MQGVVLQNIGGEKTMFGKKKKSETKHGVEAGKEQMTKLCSSSSTSKSVKSCK